MLAHKLDWDTEFFGYNIALADVHTLEGSWEGTYSHLMDWCQDNDIDCLYFLAESDDLDTVVLLEYQGSPFKVHLTDVRMTFVRDLSKPISIPDQPEIEVDPVTNADVPALYTLVTYPASRFYYDHHFRPEKVDEMYRLWVEKSYRRDLADTTLVAKVQGKLAGYVTLKGNEMVLVGVAPAYQGQGVGRRLIWEAIDYMGHQYFSQHDTIKVVTQGRNLPAQRLYQKMGFLTYEVSLVYHLWFKEAK